MEERGSEAGGCDEFVNQSISLRIATYNILNTKGKCHQSSNHLSIDRYDEREGLLKSNLYELNADILGLQEVVYGSKQLNELLCPLNKHSNRHPLNLGDIGAEQRADGYHAYEGPVQLQIFEGQMTDPNAQLDGNAVLVDKNAERRFGRVTEQEVLHISPYRSMLRLEFILKNGRRMHVYNTHLHHPIPDDLIRQHQIEGAITWINRKVKSSDDIVILMGDFNA